MSNRTFYGIGLVALGVLSVGDLAAPLLTDGQTPPMSIALIDAGLGLLSLILIWLAWRGRVAAANFGRRSPPRISRSCWPVWPSRSLPSAAAACTTSSQCQSRPKSCA